MLNEDNYFNNFVNKLKRNKEDYGFFVALIKSMMFVFSPLYIHRIYRLYKINLENIHQSFDKINEYHFKFKF